MTSATRRMVFLHGLGVLVVAYTVSATAQEAVLQLRNLNPGAGSIESSASRISCTDTCSVAVTEGDTIVLTATPAPGNEFDSWAGDCAGLEPTCTLLIDATKLVFASFKPGGNRSSGSG